MRIAMLACVVTACEPMAPSGNPIAPVAVDVATDVSTGEMTLDEETTAETADEAEADAPFTISSEELHQAAEGGVSVADEPAAAATLEPEPAATSEPTAPTPAASNAPTMKSGWPDGMAGTQWPVRLVTTVPNASPPRAILGLPDGREIVVNPGSMVPEMGLVVVAIAPGAAELARIAPAGDHATIESMTLQAQY